ncbi:hypothetical protein ELG97_37080 [Rhizobium leguminosarum]|uniref:hypothetical protein n=1 Tax=Rhizobium leguminosarum TaxID=384 RepID=UPI0010303A24|nr:hypothetical protein [Rhizobium leguminosarum]TBE73845.1 hypothetical protein ELG97_37080 [Rhizobium leguminosarum]
MTEDEKKKAIRDAMDAMAMNDKGDLDESGWSERWIEEQKQAQAEDYGESSMKVLEGMEPTRKRPKGFIADEPRMSFKERVAAEKERRRLEAEQDAEPKGFKP